MWIKKFFKKNKIKLTEEEAAALYAFYFQENILTKNTEHKDESIWIGRLKLIIFQLMKEKNIIAEQLKQKENINSSLNNEKEPHLYAVECNLCKNIITIERQSSYKVKDYVD